MFWDIHARQERELEDEKVTFEVPTSPERAERLTLLLRQAAAILRASEEESLEAYLEDEAPQEPLWEQSDLHPDRWILDRPDDVLATVEAVGDSWLWLVPADANGFCATREEAMAAALEAVRECEA